MKYRSFDNYTRNWRIVVAIRDLVVVVIWSTIWDSALISWWRSILPWAPKQDSRNVKMCRKNIWIGWCVKPYTFSAHCSILHHPLVNFIKCRTPPFPRKSDTFSLQHPVSTHTATNHRRNQHRSRATIHKWPIWRQNKICLSEIYKDTHKPLQVCRRSRPVRKSALRFWPPSIACPMKRLIIIIPPFSHVIGKMTTPKPKVTVLSSEIS